MSSPSPEALLNLLPLPARTQIAALMRQYDELHLEGAIGVALATIATATGRSTLDTHVTEPLTANFPMVLAIRDDSLLPEAISQIIAPLRSYQASSLANYRLIDGLALEAELAERQRRYLQWTLTERFPDPAHGREFQRRIMEARRLLPKLVITESLLPGAIGHALQLSPDETAFLASLDPVRTASLVAHWLSERGASELALLDAVQSERAYRGPAGEFARPLVNAILLATPDTLRAIVEAGDRVPFFWLVDATQAKTRLKRSRNDEAATVWERFIHGLLDRRFVSTPGIIPVSGQTFQYFGQELNDRTATENQPATRNRTDRDAINLVAGLAATVHMAESDATTPLTLSTVGRAVTLFHELSAKHREVVEARPESLFTRFLREAVINAPGAWLTMKDLKAAWAVYAKDRGDGAGTVSPTREQIAAAVREVCEAKMRQDMPPGLGDTRGWKNLALRAATNTAGTVQNSESSKARLLIG